MPLRPLGLLLALLLTATPPSGESKPKILDYPDKPKAPEFTGIQTWINSDALKMSDLKGKVVLIHLFAYS